MPLSDEDMLKYLGRENLEDYGADFLVMLESWKAAVKFRRARAEKSEDLDIAEFLGWTRRADGPGKRMTDTALACTAASKLIHGGYVSRDELDGLDVRSVRNLCSKMVSRHEQIDKMGKATQRPAREVEQAKQTIARAGRTVAREIKEGNIGSRQVRSRVDV